MRNSGEPSLLGVLSAAAQTKKGVKVWVQLVWGKSHPPLQQYLAPCGLGCDQRD